jgi:type IV pilus assembly protein PilY1
MRESKTISNRREVLNMKPSKLLTTFASVAAALAFSTAAPAATTDLAGTPLATASTTQVKPNIMFILDDSGSMNWEYLPDSVNGNNGSNCYRNHLYNRIYYNPAVTYTPPVDSAGASYAAASFTNAKTNGFDSGSSTRDLSDNFRAGNDGSGQLAYYYEYTGGGTPTAGTCYANNKYTKRNPTSAAEKTNFANWYSYYRTRILAMKTAAGQAFKTIDDNYRVGFTTISYTGVDPNNADFLNVSDFGAGHRLSWYDKLYGASGNSFTPLRAALSKVGQLYAGKHDGTAVSASVDPMQYSCQQNFSILSTDGYWNTNSESASYGPDKVNGSTNVGNQDGSPTVRPMLDALNKSDTLADVAMYYYQTDLRTAGANGALGTDVSENNVKGSGQDTASHQHMTTYTLGFGLSGTLNYTDDYLSGGSSDYTAIVQGTKNWPDPTCNTATCQGPARIDDLWHAAVNGRGIYFGANDAAGLVSGIQKALRGIQSDSGAGAAAATSSLEPVAGNNYAYVASYRTQYWDGELEARTIDLDTGVVSATATWNAQTLLNGKVSDSSDTRTIHKFDSAAASKLKTFTWANLSAAEQAYFTSNIANLSQYSGYTAGQLTKATGQNLLSFIRGQTGYENEANNIVNGVDDNLVFRSREYALGDIINAQPVFVAAPLFGYADTGYSAFKTAQASRDGTVYVAANDGMLHAFDATSGAENWAYVPSPVMPNLWTLADNNYANLHRYFVDGSPTVGDALIGGNWKTILVGGLNKGGRGYYAMDVTDPANPKALWNFTSDDDTDLGFSYGNPVITKRPDGTWVVLVTSGYNNVGPGDGKGYLYVLDASTGTVLDKITTNEGGTSDPSGFARINNWLDNGSSDNTTTYVYGGDLKGNLWRFDLSNNSVLKLATLAAGGVAQPITARPELGQINNQRVVLVGTGQLLGVSDLVTNAQQSFYAIKDTGTSLGDVRGGGTLVQQSITDICKQFDINGNCVLLVRTTSTNQVDWATKNGWYINLPDNVGAAGKGSERVNVDPQLHFGTLVFVSNIPNANACTAGGDSARYELDYTTGQYVSTAPNQVGGIKYFGAFAVGVNVVRLPNGKSVTITTLSDKRRITAPLSEGGSSSSNARRVSWRELLDLD